PLFDSQLPNDAAQKIYVWVRDGWSLDENSVRVDSRQAGNQSPTLFVYIPKRSADDLRHYLIEYKAATATLDKRGVPNTPEGTEARAAMETTKQTAEGKIKELLNEAFSGARVFQGGGHEIIGNDLQDMVHEAATNALQRLYPQFSTGDHIGWSKVYEKAQKGAPDALKAVGFEDEPTKNPVCKLLLSAIAGGKKGADLRSQFESSPYGWSRDTVDGGLQVLLIAGLIRAQDEQGKTVDPKALERKSIGKTLFKVEATTINTPQRIQIRKVLQKMGLTVKQGEELIVMPQFLQKMQELASCAGGEAPRPERPNTQFLDDIRLTAGNEQLLAVYNQRDELPTIIEQWTSTAEHIEQRWPTWQILKRLALHAQSLPDIDALTIQITTIEEQRQLLLEPDAITPLLSNVTQLLRDELNRLQQEYQSRHQQGMQRLEQDENWQKLEPEQRNQLLSEQKLTLSDQPDFILASTETILATLDKQPLSSLTDRVVALPARFDTVAMDAAELLEPQAQ
ncbi:MAG: BREX system P-loop protein BrxC, partial [Methylomicrobium sp.]|nr:BREX system P-loop protein BrxC [Methylomicrobium sp.]